MPIFIDPTTPPDTEAVSVGASRIRGLGSVLLKIFGFTGSSAQSFEHPFVIADSSTGRVSVRVDPVDDPDVATKRYVDGRHDATKVRLVLTPGSGGDNYQGQIFPAGADAAYPRILLLEHLGPPNLTDGPTVTIDSLTVPIKRWDGSPLKVGDLKTGSYYTAIYRTVDLLILGALGSGSGVEITQQIVIQDPGDITLGGADQTILSVPFTAGTRDRWVFAYAYGSLLQPNPSTPQDFGASVGLSFELISLVRFSGHEHATRSGFQAPVSAMFKLPANLSGNLKFLASSVDAARISGSLLSATVFEV